ncbi:MAG: valine--tRNA ligase [Candidatus Saccharimonadales bacterium]
MNLPKNYDPKAYEADIYALWEKSEAFKPSGQGEPYSIVVPPPNANGNLHIGHALTLGLQDIAVRYHRSKGDNALLLPGADHAGFETQVVYEKELAKQGKSRFDLSREQLYDEIFEFVQGNRSNFETQMRRIGAGVDWGRFTFTLDEKVVKQAYATFKKMWDEGLIYRGERLVNFCTFHGTAFADVEVVHKLENGHLWHLEYPLVNGEGSIIVATTRPETMLGDTAVAVHPDDARYKHLIGKTVKLPLTHREIPVIADEFVDREFGTGAVKITPAHDPNDFEVGKRHDLPFINVIDHQGKITHEVPEVYRGLSVDDARKQVVHDLEEQGIIVKIVDHEHNVGHCYKCDTVIQPLLRDQWFVDMQPLAKEAIKTLKDKKVAFYPEGKQGQLSAYLEQLHDWNISRQIAWGIPIPAFQNIDEPDDWIYDERVTEEFIEKDGKTYRRDPDVFDTWFSSSSWPYATLNYPDGDDFKQFYPLSLMETGGEILYPWVSRMLMLGLYVTGKIPFKAVYIHGYVMAEDGAKMSKSLGNVINPIDVIDQYGSDALRMGIVAGRAPAVNRGYDHRKVEEARNFANKLWNVARFIEGLEGADLDHHTAKPISAADHWILTKLQQLEQGLAGDLDSYRFAEGYDKLYHFVWDELADWYLEASKETPNVALLRRVLADVLTLLHPYAPFVTETIWQTLGWEKDSLLATRQWPTILKASNKHAADFEEIKNIVSESRYIIKTLHASEVTMYYTDVAFLKENAPTIKRMARLQDVTEVRDGTGIYLTQTKHRCWLDIDIATAQHYGEEIAAKQATVEKSIAQLSARLENKAYIDQAPKHLVEQTEQLLEEAKVQLESLKEEAKRFAPTA